MDFELTEYARESLRKRPNIRMTWVEQVLRNPERSEPDGIDPDLEHRLGRIDECRGRVLRHREPSGEPIEDCYRLL